ncbi:MAG TPA: hypothetical protein VLV82_00520 [Candidatus Angelobacter sp.]|nr:hypothetical protein [Candidatus Angelobacter sp.]
MTRTSAAPAPSEGTPGGATILPGVPLPLWGRAAEPVVPEPAPVPEPLPVPAYAASSAGSEVGPTAVPVSPALAPEPSPAPTFVAEDPWEGQPAEQPATEDLPAADLGPWPAPEWPAEEALVTVEDAVAWSASGWETGADDETPAGSPTELPAPTTLPVPLAAPTSAPIDLEPPAEATAAQHTGSHRAPEPEGETVASPSWTSSRRPLLLLGALVGALLLGAIAAFGWPGLLVSHDDQAEGTPASGVPAAAPVSLQTPPTVAGLSLVPGAAATALARAAGGTAIAGYAAPVSAVYGRGTTPVVTVIAWTATTRGTPADVSTAFAGYQGATGNVVRAITTVPTGALGGRMSCGSSVVGTTPASVCFWSDDATFGAITVLRPANAAAGVATATAVRAAVERRG